MLINLVCKARDISPLLKPSIACSSYHLHHHHYCLILPEISSIQPSFYFLPSSSSSIARSETVAVSGLITTLAIVVVREVAAEMVGSKNALNLM